LPGFVLNFENLKSFCERQKFQFLVNVELGQLAVLYKILGKDAPLILIPRLERGMLTLALALPFRVPLERYPLIGEALARLNASSYMGAWVLNFEKGEIYFRVTLPALDNEYTDQGLFFAARVVVSSAEAMAQRLSDVMAGTLAPKDILPTTANP
jgi:hypothetical protein